MSKSRLRSLSDRAKVVGYGADRLVLGEGVRGGGSVFVLLEGTARVEVGGRTVGRLGPGDVFGELALLDGRPRSASVVAGIRHRHRPTLANRVPRPRQVGFGYRPARDGRTGGSPARVPGQSRVVVRSTARHSPAAFASFSILRPRRP